MSQKIITYCDFCNPETRPQIDRVESWMHYAREDLKEFGWKFVNGKDICPQCVQEGIKA